MRLTEDTVRDALRQVDEPHFALDVVTLGLVRTVSISRGRVAVTIAEPLEDWPRRDELVAVGSPTRWQPSTGSRASR